ncbi:aminoglycoside phosphotransferase family protein [Salinibacterium sp. GXW1014]|uniref:aminoglycoside phosphotransferase family protein n=1 Tax=Salinibacterium sp. GXW1014 TaxID=3377838 RepID=UPI00383AC757
MPMWTPAQPEDYLAQWGLTVAGETLTTPSSTLIPVSFDGRDGMLKVARIDEEARGNSVLAWWNGAGAAPVWRVDEHAVLLARATGRSLATIAIDGDDHAATLELCSLAQTLHGASAVSSPPVGLVALADWFRELFEMAEHDPHGADGLWSRAAGLAATLLADASQDVVLHGDLHHDNVLDFGDGDWRAIDPKGVHGNRLFDYTVLLRNPRRDVALERFEKRVELIAESSGAAVNTVLGWAIASCALSAAWSTHDGDSEAASASLELARLAERMLRDA